MSTSNPAYRIRNEGVRYLSAETMCGTAFIRMWRKYKNAARLDSHATAASIVKAPRHP